MHYIPDDRFQYRKRYYPVATALRQMYMAKDQCFNTASGMAQLQRKVVSLVAVITDGFNTASGITQLQLLCKETEINGELFQYRKRYGPVATVYNYVYEELGGDLFQYRKRYGPVATWFEIAIMYICG